MNYQDDDRIPGILPKSTNVLNCILDNFQFDNTPLALPVNIQ